MKLGKTDIYLFVCLFAFETESHSPGHPQTVCVAEADHELYLLICSLAFETVS